MVGNPSGCIALRYLLLPGCIWPGSITQHNSGQMGNVGLYDAIACRLFNRVQYEMCRTEPRVVQHDLWLSISVLADTVGCTVQSRLDEKTTHS